MITDAPGMLGPVNLEINSCSSVYLVNKPGLSLLLKSIYVLNNPVY